MKTQQQQDRIDRRREFPVLRGRSLGGADIQNGAGMFWAGVLGMILSAVWMLVSVAMDGRIGLGAILSAIALFVCFSIAAFASVNGQYQ